MCFAPQRRALFRHFFDIWTSKSGPNMVCFGHFDIELCFAPQRRALFRHLNFQKWSEHGVLCTFWLRNVLRATTACTFSTLFRHLNLQKWSKHGVLWTFWHRIVLRATKACTFSTSELPKVVRAWCALYILTSKCASRHNGVHFFDIWTSKSDPTMVCFVHFDFQMCFAPQRRALFRHLNFQKWSESGVLCTFWLGNVLRATTACTFSTLFRHLNSKSGPSMVCFVHFDFEMCFAPQRRALFRHLNFQKWSDNGVFCSFWLPNVLRATTACTFSTSKLPKVVRIWCALYILTWKCASRHNGVHFFNTFSTSEFQKWSEHGVFWTFWLRNVLRATTACTLSTSELPKVVRTWCALYILTSKCASRHNGVHFFISHLASWLRTRRFSEPTFRPSGDLNHRKNIVNRDFLTFSRICIFFLLTLSLLTLLTSAFQLSILSEVSLLNFLLWEIPGDPCRPCFSFASHGSLDISRDTWRFLLETPKDSWGHSGAPLTWIWRSTASDFKLGEVDFLRARIANFDRLESGWLLSYHTCLLRQPLVNHRLDVGVRGLS